MQMLRVRLVGLSLIRNRIYLYSKQKRRIMRLFCCLWFLGCYKLMFSQHERVICNLNNMLVMPL